MCNNTNIFVITRLRDNIPLNPPSKVDFNEAPSNYYIFLA